MRLLFSLPVNPYFQSGTLFLQNFHFIIILFNYCSNIEDFHFQSIIFIERFFIFFYVIIDLFHFHGRGRNKGRENFEFSRDSLSLSLSSKSLFLSFDLAAEKPVNVPLAHSTGYKAPRIPFSFPSMLALPLLPRERIVERKRKEERERRIDRKKKKERANKSSRDPNTNGKINLRKKIPGGQHIHIRICFSLQGGDARTMERTLRKSSLLILLLSLLLAVSTIYDSLVINSSLSLC